MIAMRTLVLALLAACGYSTPNNNPDLVDAPVIPPIDADEVRCDAPTFTCSDEVTLTATCEGQPNVNLPCTWGCLSTTSPPRCAELVPTGGAVVPSDLDPTGLGDIVLQSPPDPPTIDGSGTGSINGMGIPTGVAFRLAGDVAVFRFRSLRIANALDLEGERAIALVADGPIVIDGVIDVRGPCGDGAGRGAGPGGRNGGSDESSASGDGGGTGTGAQDAGGGGGGYGRAGGAGDGAVAGGGTFGDDVISVLVGGGGGGGGKTSEGGGGGGAIQLVSNTSITINAGINAGGCGGPAGNGAADSGGGGGGAGGTIVLEAPTITIASVLAVNGGGGGNRNSTGSGGRLDRNRASAASGGGTGGAGTGVDGTSASSGSGNGGGGGGVGRMRFNARVIGNIVLQAGAVLSPAFGDSNTTASRGAATTQ